MFFHTQLSKSLSSTIRNPVCDFSILTSWKPRKLSLEWDTIKPKFLSQSECLERVRKNFKRKRGFILVNSKQTEFPFHRGIGQQCRRKFSALGQVVEKSTFHFGVSFSFQLQNVSMLTCWKLLHQKLQKMLLVENFPGQLLKARESKFWDKN